MNLKNLLGLTIRSIDFNLVAKQPLLLEKLRQLTIHPDSGLNYEMDRMLKAIEEREVNCQVLLAYRFGDLIGWSILSKEETDFPFCGSGQGFKKEDGWMFQVFIESSYRRRGIASNLYQFARELIGDEAICICPWDTISYCFYNKFPDVNHKKL